MVIVIEGANGTGKTTLAMNLAKVMSYEYVHFPTKNGDKFPGLITWFGDLFRATGNQKYARWDMDVNEKIIAKHAKVVVDRMRLSNYVYSIINFEIPGEYNRFKEITLVMNPDLLVGRLSHRDNHCAFEDKNTILEQLTKANNLFEMHGSRIINVDGLSQTQVLDRALTYIHKP
jgi:thymidylate kinase